MTQAAPFFADVADAPADGHALWVTSSDGVRIRVGLFGADAPKGTVLLFPGRTEYIEKYGRAACDLRDRGYATLVVDWRGQGLADRLLDDAMPGHVHHFADYQHDVASVLATARAQGLPEPYYLLAHSMGGAIGLRAVMQDLPVVACAFSGPMWGINFAIPLRPVAWTLSWGSAVLGMGHVFAPGTGGGTYVLTEAFDANKLTTDRPMWDYMRDQAQSHPELTISGPTLRWLHEALKDTLELHAAPSPALPCYTFVGGRETIVDMPRIKARMARWPGGTLDVVADAEHEVMMEGPDTRARIFDALDSHFSAAKSGTGTARSA